MKTLLVIVPLKNKRMNSDDIYCSILVAETGEVLASHVCSHQAWAYGDLYDNRQERKDEWTKRFGELEVKYIDETDLTEDELLRRNKQWFASLPEEDKV